MATVWQDEKKLVGWAHMEHMSKYQSIVFMGKSASGKGTQSSVVHEQFGGVIYSNGNKIRETATLPTVFGMKMKEIYEGGYLMPEWIATYWMTHALVHEHAEELIVFEAVAKKPNEAKLFHEIHTWIGRPYIVFNLEISDEVVHARSASRARDVVDGPKSVEKRLDEYRTYTNDSIEFFRSVGTLVDIDGTASVDAIKVQIFNHLSA